MYKLVTIIQRCDQMIYVLENINSHSLREVSRDEYLILKREGLIRDV